MDPDSWRQILAIIGLLGLSAFFSSSETSLTSISKLKIKSMVKNNVKGAIDVEALTEDTDKLLSAILVGNNIVNVSLSSLAAGMAMKIAGNSGAALGISTLVVTILILIFGEITPKTLAARYADKLAPVIAKPIKGIVFFLTPVTFILNKITGGIIALAGNDSDEEQAILTEAELKHIVDLSHEEGIIEGDEKTMINNVFDFGDGKAEQVMTPRTDIIAVPVDAAYSEIMEVFREEHFSRMPVYEEDVDHIIGIINFKDFIFSDSDDATFNIRDHIRKPLFSYENKETSELFAQMRQGGYQMAIILDEYAGTAGLVTIEDLMEEIVGEIEDEYDEEEEKIIRIKDNEYLLDGMLKIDEFSAATGLSLVSEDYQSIGGYVTGVIGDIPAQGDVIKSPEVTFIVEKAEKNRIEKVRAIINAPDEEKEEELAEMNEY